MSTSYNRLIIVGNGFDRFLGLPTAYKDFMLWYIKTAILESYKTGFYDDDCLLLYNQKVSNLDYWNNKISQYDDVKELIESEFTTLRKVDYKDPLISSLISSMHNGNWVDIEQHFFELLIDAKHSVDKLNKSIEQLAKKLNEYLKSLNYSALDNVRSLTLLDRMFDPLYNESAEIVHSDRQPKRPENTLILNFNYTPALRFLLDNSIYSGVPTQHVHGSIYSGKPLIFGYGDDSHPAYQDLENGGNNALLKNIKSFHYSRDFEYHKLLTFIDSAKYEVFIVGHSCGLSDRVLLKQIFEHGKCKAIQIFHRLGIPNDFQDKHINVSRHFTNKLKMRRIVLPENSITSFPESDG